MSGGEWTQAGLPFDCLDDPATYDRFDPTGMLHDIAQAAIPIQEGPLRRAGVEPIRASRVIVAGMGASGIIGDILQSLAHDEGAIPVVSLHRSTLPRWHDHQDLLLAVSYSGETPEVLSVAAEAEARGGPVIAISSGGKLSDWARPRGINLLPVKAGFEPRAALSGLLTPALAACVQAKVFEDIGFEDLATALEADLHSLQPGSPRHSNPAKRIAHRLHGRTPIFTAAGHLSPVATRWSAQWAENAKLTSVAWNTPEVLHNAVEALDDVAASLTPCVVILRDTHLCQVDTMSLDLLASTCGERGVDCLVLKGRGRSRLSSLLRLVQWGDFASAYLGILRGERIAELSIIPGLRSVLRQAGTLARAS